MATRAVAQQIAQLDDPAHIQTVADCAAIFNEREAAKALLAQWEAADPRGTPTEIDLRDKQLAIAREKFDTIESKFRDFRGDFGDTDTAHQTQSTVNPSLPTPLTTSDIAHCFADPRWLVEDGLKKRLGNKPKWLAVGIAIPGRRGLNETRWNPVLVGAAIVRAGHAKVNNVRAKFQTNPLLKPWLEAWKTHEADNFDTP